jgi:hypothetical protein
LTVADVVSTGPSAGWNAIVSRALSARLRRSFFAAAFRRSGTRTAPAAAAATRTPASPGFALARAPNPPLTSTLPGPGA